MEQATETRSKGYFRSSPSTAFDQYLQDIQKLPLISDAAEERRLARLAQKGDEAAAERLVTANLRFAVKVSYEYRSYGIKVSDLIQEANIGLMKAVQKFDPDAVHIEYPLYDIHSMYCCCGMESKLHSRSSW